MNGTLSYLASDLLGSATVALNASGVPTASQLYAPYGIMRYGNGTLPTDYGFTGQRADNATGLDYYGARYYDPALGQFTSADTVQDGLNRYGYVGGNPIIRIDPSGHFADKWGTPGGGGAAFGAKLVVGTAALAYFEVRNARPLGSGPLSNPTGYDELTRALHVPNIGSLDDLPYWNQVSVNRYKAASKGQSGNGGGGGGSGPGRGGGGTGTGTGTGVGSGAPATQAGGGSAGSGAPPGGGVPPVAGPAYPEDDGCWCGDSGVIRPLYHGTTWNGADDILQNGIRDTGRPDGDPDFYTTPNKQLAADFSGWRVTPDDPYRALLRFDVPGSVLDSMKAGGLVSVSPFLNSGELEVRFKPESWSSLMQYLTEVRRITGPRDEGC